MATGGEDIILGTDYDDFPALLETAGREQALKSWWEEVPIGSDTDDQKPTRAILSKKQKREQRQWYA
ncbi:hypothetical protein NDU88_006405 [Pleurodeles waltl]|uniref:Uncharacterized protein n=1 Tax=Pleurodeles waltl TaxID=8319 RepID=A0AAV7WEQ3_PLEWA|nr:hypothetical protein NDU88_006405 [Pleurodeles waltl]